MKKLFTFFIILLFTLFLMPYHVSAKDSVFYNIKTCVGEDEKSIGINYHSSVESSQILLSESQNPTLENSIIVNPTVTSWGKGMTNNEERTIFNERYICQANISNLKLNTTYYYKIVANDAESKVCSFKTTDSTKTTFGVLCDTQASGSNFQYSDTLVKKMLAINSDISFFMIAGDIVDRGGYEDQWDNFDQYMSYYNTNCLQATIPGNHELYHSSSGTYEDASIYNKYYNNPQNGPTKRLNSTYYFKYNNILFIMLDTMHRSNGQNYFDEQVAWFKNVVINNPSEFIIVVSHPGCYSAGAYTSDASQMRSVWQSTFEEYGVDLAISGHEHIYLKTKPLYKDKVDEEKGLIYLIGGCAGAKHYSGKTNNLIDVLLENDNPNGTYCGSIVEVEGNTLKLAYYDMYGNKRDSFTLTSKKAIDPDFTPQDVLNSLDVYYNEKSRKNVLTWDKRAFGIIKYYSIYIEHLDVTLENKYMGPSINESAISIGTPDKDYHYTITLTDYNDQEYIKKIDVINDQTLLRPSDFILIIEEGEDFKYQIHLDYDIKKCEKIALELIYNNKTYDFNDEDDLILTLSEEIDLDKIIINLIYNFYGVADDKELTSADLKMVTNLINHEQIEPDPIDPEPDIDDNEPINPLPNDNQEKKKGCKKNKNMGILIVGVLSLCSLSLIIINKKH